MDVDSQPGPLPVFAYRQGSRPLLMSVPHVGTYLPSDLASRMTEPGRLIADTDWNLDRLYNFSEDLGISVIAANYSRYVIDLNRSPDNQPLYAGANNTELVPTSTFADAPIYGCGGAPSEEEIALRRTRYWVPYHRRIEIALGELRPWFNRVVLFDCHSIKSVVPRFFKGTLPDFNLGTGGGTSCDPGLRDRLDHVLRASSGYSLAVDGRFKGGYITRHYGRPAENIHAFQLELSGATYMDEEPPFSFREDLAGKVRPTLRAMVEAAVEWAEAH